MLKKIVFILILLFIVALVYFYYLPQSERNKVVNSVRAQLPKQADELIECTSLVDNEFIQVKKHAVYQWKDENGTLHYGDAPPAHAKTKDVSHKFSDNKNNCKN